MLYNSFFLSFIETRFFNPFVPNLKPKGCNFIKNESLAQVFYCEFYEISKNTFFTEHLRTTAFGVPYFK